MEAVDQLFMTQVEQINRIILNLYETSQPFHTRITNFFQAMTELVYFDKASLLFFFQDADGTYRKRNSITLNWDASLLEAYDQGLYKLDDTLAPVDRSHHVLLLSSTYFSEERRRETPFWVEYQQPSNADYEIFGNVLTHDPGGLRCKICFARGKKSSDFQVFDLRIIKLFQPHLSRITAQYLRQHESVLTMEQVENYNCVGFCVIDENCQLVKSNETFNRLNQRVGNKLLYKLVDICNNFKDQDSSQVLSCEYKLDNEPLFLEIVRTEGKREVSVQYGCMVYDLSHFFTGTLMQLRQKYQLSEREYEVFLLIIQGLRNEDIAQKLYLSVPSIKKCVASIFGKLGISNQKQIFSKLNLL